MYIYMQMGVYMTLFAYVHVYAYFYMCGNVNVYTYDIWMMLVCGCISACTYKYICV